MTPLASGHGNISAAGQFFYKMDTLRIFFRYIRYRLTARHRKGHGIHSPFMYTFVSEVVFGRDNPSLIVPAKIICFHRSLRKSREVIGGGRHGAGSHVSNGAMRHVSDMTRHSGVSPRHGALLYRMARYFCPGEILELGTGTGASTAYLRAGAPAGSRVVSVEGEKDRTDFARSAFAVNGFPEVQFVNTHFDDFLRDWKPVDHPLLVFLDGDHTFPATLRYYRKVAEYARHDTILVIDDIHWSADMEKAWKAIRQDSRAALTADLFFMGIVFFREGVISQDFMIQFLTCSGF